MRALLEALTCRQDLSTLLLFFSAHSVAYSLKEISYVDITNAILGNSEVQESNPTVTKEPKSNDFSDSLFGTWPLLKQEYPCLPVSVLRLGHHLSSTFIRTYTMHWCQASTMWTLFCSVFLSISMSLCSVSHCSRRLSAFLRALSLSSCNKYRTTAMMEKPLQ